MATQRFRTPDRPQGLRLAAALTTIGYTTDFGQEPGRLGSYLVTVEDGDLGPVDPSVLVDYPNVEEA